VWELSEVDSVSTSGGSRDVTIKRINRREGRRHQHDPGGSATQKALTARPITMSLAMIVDFWDLKHLARDSHEGRRLPNHTTIAVCHIHRCRRTR